MQIRPIGICGTRHEQPVRRRIPELFESPPNGLRIVMYLTRTPNAPIHQQHLDRRGKLRETVSASARDPNHRQAKGNPGSAGSAAAVRRSPREFRARRSRRPARPLIAEPQARTVATVGIGCRLPGGITNFDGRERSPRISRHSTARPSGSRPGRHAILDPQQRLLVEAPRRRSRTPASNGSSY